MKTNKRLYGQNDIYNTIGYSGSWFFGTWQGSFNFTYLEGATVFFNLSCDCISPEWTGLDFFIGENESSLVKIIPNSNFPIQFTGTSGSMPFVLKIKMKSGFKDLSPIINSLNINIIQETSLYSVATELLRSGLEGTGQNFIIDTAIQNIPIEYGFLDKENYRDLLDVVAEACGGTIYSDRNGNIILDSIFSDDNVTVNKVINQNKIYDSRTPVSEIRNIIRVKSSPLVKLESQEVWTGAEEAIELNETREIEIFFSDFETVLNPIASITGSATIESENLYTWGGRVKIKGTSAGSFLLKVNGEPLVVRGAKISTAIDTPSVRQNGEKELIIEDNKLIQSSNIAKMIADKILLRTAKARRDIEGDWRGNPVLELGDVVLFDNQKGQIVEQNFNFNGTLRSEIKIKRID